MDELDILKENWQKEDTNKFKTYTESELFKLTKKHTISISKWIFIIGLLDIIFWASLNFLLVDKNDENTLKNFLSPSAFYFIEFISDITPLIFLGILIYLNHKIKNTDNPRKLMKKILMMKNTVRWYIRVFLFQFSLGIILGFMMFFHNKEEETSTELFMAIIILLFISIIIILFIRFLYKLIYGRFVDKLEKNYKELNQIEEIP